MSNQVNDDEEEKINVRDRLTDNLLDLSLMNISKVPVEDIKALRRATTLDLSNNRITIIESSFTDLTQLTQLDLSKNRITSICDDFGLLTNLRRLDLYNNQITRLPLTFGRLRNLKYLDLKNNPLHPTFKKLVGTCTDTNDCLVAASRAVDFMKHVERQVVEGRNREREQREEAERAAEEEQLKKENPVSTNGDQKQDKSKRKRKHDTGAVPDNAEQKASAEGRKATSAKSTSIGARVYSMLWVLIMVLLAVGTLLFSKHSDKLKSFWTETVGGSRDTILEEYIK